jgi:hypothetical protein
MLNFAEQTGSGAVIVVWSSLNERGKLTFRKYTIGPKSFTFPSLLSASHPNLADSQIRFVGHHSLFPLVSERRRTLY